jgi:uncharacterized damage-inducible protein DinB
MFDRNKVLEEFDQEMARTRRMLKGVPADRMDWSPHEKSWTLGELATHLAQLPGWTGPTLQAGELDLAAMDREALAPPSPGPKGLLDLFDRLVGEARKAVESVSVDAMEDPWTLRTGETEIFTVPRWNVFRMTVLNHIIHHRAQLGVYLRLLDLPVPQVYGSTADNP